MKGIDRISRTPNWTWVTLIGLFVLSIVDRIRAAGIASDSVVVGSLPNLVAVPVLTYGFLMIMRPPRGRSGAVLRLFRLSVATVTFLVAAWEFLQLSGNLVFDPTDLVFTGLGTILTLMLYPLAVRGGPVSSCKDAR